MKHLFLVLAAGLFLSVSSCNNSSAPKTDNPGKTKITETQEIKVPSKNFTVTFPVKAVEISNETLSVEGVGKVPHTLYFAEKDAAGYFVNIAEYPKKITEHTDIDEMLKNGVSGMLQQFSDVKIKSEKFFKMKSHRGIKLEATGTAEGYKMYMRSVTILSGSRLYHIYVLADKKNRDRSDIREFFNSFKLLKRKP